MSIEPKFSLPSELQKLVSNMVAEWDDDGKVKRLWGKDASLWTGDDEADWLGWLDLAPLRQQDLERLGDLQESIANAGFESAVLLGVGGASLCADALIRILGRRQGFPTLQILDTIDPPQVRALRESLDLKKTVFIVSSKSGSTLEPKLLRTYFFNEAQEHIGERAGSHFIAITDPGSKLEHIAREGRFRNICYGDPAITVSYPALSDFGIVPAVIAGLDIRALLSEAQQAVEACKQPEAIKNPGVHLGLILGAAALNKRDKLTIFVSPELQPLSAWLEQLIAESTGKDGKGITPIIAEHIAPPSHYGKDRIFAYIKLEGSKDKNLDRLVEKLEQAGQPVVRFTLDHPSAIAAQFFLWQIAAIVAASVIGVNPFHQPYAETARVETRMLLDDCQETGKLKLREPVYAEGGEHGMLLYASKKYIAKLKRIAGEKAKLEALLKAHLDQIKPGDYFAILAYLEPTGPTDETLQFFRHQVRGAKKAATCLGFGPPFEHSTGQNYKDGVNAGVFLQITAEHASAPTSDLPVPGSKYTFATVMDAQAAADLAALEQRNRRVVRVHLAHDIKAGLKRLSDIIESAIKDS